VIDVSLPASRRAWDFGADAGEVVPGLVTG